MLNMRLLPGDRTARARIRDEALRLFGTRGPDAVSIRDLAQAAGVSPALVIRHYGTKDGLRQAVDEHVGAVFESMLAEVTDPAVGEPLDAQAAPTLADLMARHLPADSAIPAYLGRMLLANSDAGASLFRRLHAVAREALADLVRTGAATPGEDPAVRAAFLLVNDLALLMLRERLREVLGVDPLSAEGMRRWGAEVLTIYRSGLGGAPDGV
jgi:AcrR family transcriptional regulator